MKSYKITSTMIDYEGRTILDVSLPDTLLYDVLHTYHIHLDENESVTVPNSDGDMVALTSSGWVSITTGASPEVDCVGLYIYQEEDFASILLEAPNGRSGTNIVLHILAVTEVA